MAASGGKEVRATERSVIAEARGVSTREGEEQWLTSQKSGVASKTRRS